MSSRIPRHFRSASAGGLDALQYEILQEKTAVLARLGRRAEAALEALRAFDAAHEPGSAAAERDALVAAAGEAVWYYAVQREVLGMHDNEAVLRELRVPREVRLRMGVRPAAPRS